MTTTLPAELALEREPDLQDIICSDCNVGPAEFIDADGEALCLTCADANPERHLERSEPWRIDDLDKAEWAMRKLSAINKELAEKESIAEAWTRKISEWLEGEIKPLVKHREFFEGHLEAYARELRERENIKTLKLPSGRVKSTYKAARPQVVDEDSLIEWLETHDVGDIDELVRVKKSVVKDAFKKLVEKDALKKGDVVLGNYCDPPGVVVEAEAVSYKVEVSE